MDGLELYDIYDVWHVPFWQTTAWYVVVGLLLSSIAIALSVLLARYVMQRVRRKEVWQQILDEFALLEKQPCNTPADSKAIYFSLTALLKKYMVYRYGCARMSDTDQEFLQSLKNTPISHATQAMVHDIFSESLVIKFARMPAVREHIVRDIAQSIILINDTLPIKNK